MRSGRRSPLKRVTSCRLPVLRDAEVRARQPQHGAGRSCRGRTRARARSRRCATKVGLVGIGVRARAEASRTTVREAGGAASDLRRAPSGAPPRRASRWRRPRAGRLLALGSRGSPNPRSASSERIVRSLIPALRKRTRSQWSGGHRPGPPRPWPGAAGGRPPCSRSSSAETLGGRDRGHAPRPGERRPGPPGPGLARTPTFPARSQPPVGARRSRPSHGARRIRRLTLLGAQPVPSMRVSAGAWRGTRLRASRSCRRAAATRPSSETSPA